MRWKTSCCRWNCKAEPTRANAPRYRCARWGSPPAPTTCQNTSPAANSSAARAGAAAAQVIELMLELNRAQGTTLILVTHDEALARRCGRQLRLEAGRVQ